MKDRTKCRADQSRPMALVNSPSRKVVGLDWVVMPTLLTARKAAEWRGLVLLAPIETEHFPLDTLREDVGGIERSWGA